MKILFSNNRAHIVVRNTKARPIFNDYIGAYYLKKNKNKEYIKDALISKARAIYTNNGELNNKTDTIADNFIKKYNSINGCAPYFVSWFLLHKGTISKDVITFKDNSKAILLDTWQRFV